MPKYMVMGSYTSEAWARMVENPSDRAAVARAAAESVGGTLEAFYWAFGPDDFVAIADVPDDASAAAVSVGVSSSGMAAHMRTIRLFTMSEGMAMLQRAKAVAAGYRPPGA